jgi:hypothetical protein
MNLYDRVRTAALRKFKDDDVGRVIDCWDEFSKGNVLERYIDDCPSTTKTELVTIEEDRVLQRADCYVKGLTAKCFFDPEEYSWSKGLGERYKDILQELQKYESKQVQRMISEGQTWLPPRDTSGNAYGPEWRTLGLQDRSVWDEEKLQDFPLTVGLLKDLKVPSCEVFFAKQGVVSVILNYSIAPNTRHMYSIAYDNQNTHKLLFGATSLFFDAGAKSGIKPHSDKNNFICTCHVALDVPEGECWIQVGNKRYFWKVS